ncbi:hypothetical protein K1719_008308 [Acacia pycnantha]|nr:hypothetical protein K1719_008308 [Acacia pycnantha]
MQNGTDAVGALPPRVYVGHSVYKGKAALTVTPRPPEFASLEVGYTLTHLITYPFFKQFYQQIPRNLMEMKKYPRPFPFSFYHLLEQSLPIYNMLQRHVKKSSLLTPPLPPPDLPVPANEKLLAWVGDEIEPRESAKKA